MNFKKEIPIIAIVLLPFIYLAMIWKDLPDQVPMHWNLQGEIDRYGHKSELLFIPFLLPFLVYILFLIIPMIDPKGQMNKMGNKLQTLKFILTTFMSVLAMYIIYSTKYTSTTNVNFIFLLMGFLFIILGNYFKTIKPNYFIGIRTPWTLENEVVWKKTHRLGGVLWFIGGILIVVFSLILDSKSSFILFMIITGIITIVPIIYSYLRYKSEMK